LNEDTDLKMQKEEMNARANNITNIDKKEK